METKVTYTNYEYSGEYTQRCIWCNKYIEEDDAVVFEHYKLDKEELFDLYHQKCWDMSVKALDELGSTR